MLATVQRIFALCLTGLLLCQVVFAGSGGLQLCMPSSGGHFHLDFNCAEPDGELCCGESHRGSLTQAKLGQACELCFDLELKAESGDPLIRGERGSPKLPVLTCAPLPDLPPAAEPRTLFIADVYPQRAPPQANDALRQFRDVVSLRI